MNLKSSTSLRSFAVSFLALTLLACGAACAGPNWPEFRGPGGDGVSDATELPVTWSESKHVGWKTAIHDRGWSTPVVWGDQLWLTTATEDGRRLFAIGVDARSGKILHDLKLFDVENPQPLMNPVNSYASPSAAIEEGRVYVHFGSYGTACLETASGRVLWERRDLPCDHFRGPGSSPIFYRDLLILTMDGFDVQYLCALDRKTGKTAWKTDRSYEFGNLDGDIRKAYSTPIVFRAGAEEQLVSAGAKAAYAYDPASGRELWRVRYDGFSNASRPVFGHGLVFISTGFSKADLWAVKPDGRGDVTATHVTWKCRQAVPLKPSPVLVGDLLFMMNDGGIASCLDARSGDTAWRERIGGQYSASPVYGAGRVYFPSEEGKTFVVRADRTFKVLAENQLENGSLASPAIAGKALFLRTKTHLYRIEE
jgi:outer membrane protein assembly factor BamB